MNDNTYLPFFKDLYNYKEKLQLETWHNNHYLSTSMKEFFNDIIHNMNELNHYRVSIDDMRKDISDIGLFLDAKNIKNDFTSFQMFMRTNPDADILQIKAFFRKQKIQKILNEEF